MLSCLSAVRVVLVGTTHPGNIGSAARAMKTMGLTRMVLVAPQRFPSAEATTLAAGADDLLAAAQVVPVLEEAVSECVWAVGTSARTRGHAVPAMSPPQAAHELLERACSGPVALVFGRESSGLSNDELDRCNAFVQIPTDPGFRSLNLAAAVQVMSYACRMAALENGCEASSGDGGFNPDPPATQGEIEALFGHYQRVLVRIGFVDAERPRHLMRRLRHLYLRAGLTASEVRILRGILSDTERGIEGPGLRP